MESISYDEFFVMIEADTKGAINAKLLDSHTDVASLFHGMGVDRTYSFQKSKGNRLLDFISAGYAFLYLISEKVCNLLKQNNLTGWSIYPISFGNIAGYQGFSVTGKSGPVINELSKSVSKPLPMDQSKEYNTWIGLYFNLSTWDNSDFFSPTGTNHIFVTRRVKDIFEKEKISNIKFMPISEVENFNLVLNQ